MRARFLFSLAVLFCAALPFHVPLLAQAPSAGKQLVQTNSGLALRGYDPVSYFKGPAPLKGSPERVSSWMGVTYRFASAENQKAFEANPAQYVPLYGGYCGYAASLNALAPGDPLQYLVHDNKLILQKNAEVKAEFEKATAENYQKANTNWPGLVQQHGKERKLLLNIDKKNLALKGYDPVAYFTDNKAVKGDEQYRATHEGANYLFASAEHKAMFEANPDKYAPAYGGYCGYAASINKLAPIDPEVFQITGNRLVLQYSKGTYEKFNKDLKDSLNKADGYWPTLVEENAGKENKGSFSSFF